MKVPKHPTLARRMTESRLKKLVPRGPVLGASLVQIARSCGHDGCPRCQRGEKHPGHFLTYKEAGKTRTVYVPVDLVEEVRSWIEEHRRLKRLMKEVSDLSIARVRGHVKARKRRRGRS